ncbi:MAG: 2-succinyl-6-hydroxy-2,4-cyclohexadiene-1-carboxylate synthase [Ktedonobacteraceae bacterium]
MGRMFVRVNGVQLGIEERREARKSGLTLVMLHGFTGSAAGWGSHLETLAAYGWRVIALDLPGHGQSDAPDEPQLYALESCQQYILAALQELGVSQGEAVLLGYSMGGRIALYTAFSGLFRALILESASPGLEDPVEREQRRISDEALAASIERDGVQTFVDRWEKLPLFASQSTLPLAAREALHRQRLHNRASGLAQSLRGVGTGVQPSQYARLPALHIPVLLIVGELDTKFTAIARSMAQALPQSQLCIVPGAGHAVHLEQPEEFDALVRDFSLSMIPSPEKDHHSYTKIPTAANPMSQRSQKRSSICQ